MVVYGCVWLVVYGCVRLCMVVYGCVLLCKVVYGCVRLCTVIPLNPRFLLTLQHPTSSS